jgi:hypothetical protein
LGVLGGLVMTLGFEPGPLVSAFASAVAEGLSEGARVLVLTAPRALTRDGCFLCLKDVAGLPFMVSPRVHRAGDTPSSATTVAGTGSWT